MGKLGKIIGALTVVGTVAAGAVAAGVKSVKKKMEDSRDTHNEENKEPMKVTERHPMATTVNLLEETNKPNDDNQVHVQKCPHCKAVLESGFETTCAWCGESLQGIERVKTNAHSVQMFSNQLMEIEADRKPKKDFFLFKDKSVDPVDYRKLSLIRSFPVPNTLDDILEFMHLATTNIDVDLSKQNYNDIRKTEETSGTIVKTISDAWVAKMQQVYQKAEILFSKDPIFFQVKKIYLMKMQELKLLNRQQKQELKILNRNSY